MHNDPVHINLTTNQVSFCFSVFSPLWISLSIEHKTLEDVPWNFENNNPHFNHFCHFMDQTKQPINNQLIKKITNRSTDDEKYD